MPVSAQVRRELLLTEPRLFNDLRSGAVKLTGEDRLAAEALLGGAGDDPRARLSAAVRHCPLQTAT